MRLANEIESAVRMRELGASARALGWPFLANAAERAAATGRPSVVILHYFEDTLGALTPRPVREKAAGIAEAVRRSLDTGRGGLG